MAMSVPTKIMWLMAGTLWAIIVSNIILDVISKPKHRVRTIDFIDIDKLLEKDPTNPVLLKSKSNFEAIFLKWKPVLDKIVEEEMASQRALNTKVLLNQNQYVCYHTLVYAVDFQKGYVVVTDTNSYVYTNLYNYADYENQYKLLTMQEYIKHTNGRPGIVSGHRR